MALYPKRSKPACFSATLIKMNINRLLLFLSVILPLAACAPKQIELDSPAHDKILKEDLKTLGMEAPSTSRPAGQKTVRKALSLTLEKAVHKGIRHNFDARLSAFNYLAQKDQVTLAQLETLPSLTASGTRLGRSNQGASSSESALDGDISLEPSFSTEPNRKFLDLEAKWNMTEAALAYIDARTQSNRQNILRARYKKVRNGIARDVYSAYWKALAYQENRDATRALLNELDAQLENLNKAKSEKLLSSRDYVQRRQSLLEARTEMAEQYRQLKLASAELKSLLSLPVKAKIELAVPSPEIAEKYQDLLTGDIGKLEMDALRNRPELREEILVQNRNANTRRKEILRALPGAEFLYAFNRDTNKFLVDHSWTNYSASLTQKLTELIKLPQKLETIDNDKERSRLKRLNLSFAIISQIHIAHQQLVFASQAYKTASAQARLSSEKQNFTKTLLETGTGSRENNLKARLENQITQLRSVSAHSDLQGAYAGLTYSLGLPAPQTPGHPDRPGGGET